MTGQLIKARYARELKLKDQISELTSELASFKRANAILENQVEQLKLKVEEQAQMIVEKPNVVYTQDDMPERYVLVLPSKVRT